MLPSDIETFSDLWTDVFEAKDKATTQLEAIDREFSVQSVVGVLAQEISLTQFTRVPLWLLGLD